MLDLPNWSDLSPDDRRAIIMPLWKDGNTAASIAGKFVGATRNMVMGTIHRAKLHRDKPTPVVKPAPKKVNRVKTQTLVDLGLEEYKAKPDRIDIVNTNRPPLPGIEPISMLELPNRPGFRCRFPVVGGYCGDHIGQDDMYCPTHRRFMYAPSALAKKDER